MEAVLSRLTALEARMAVLEARLATLESHRSLYYQWVGEKPAVATGCSCPVNTVCNSVSCPRATRVTCSVGD